MAMLDEEGEHYRCDRCGAEYDYDQEKHDIEKFWGWTIFNNRPKPRFADFCHKCAKEVTPLVYALRDVDELTIYVNKLERAINEKRRKTRNDRPTAHDACECCKGCTQRRPGHRQSDSFAQAGEEHF